MGYLLCSVLVDRTRGHGWHCSYSCLLFLPNWAHPVVRARVGASEEWMTPQLSCRWPHVGRSDAHFNEESHFQPLNAVQHEGLDALTHLAPDLSGVAAQHTTEQHKAEQGRTAGESSEHTTHHQKENALSRMGETGQAVLRSLPTCTPRTGTPSTPFQARTSQTRICRRSRCSAARTALVQ